MRSSHPDGVSVGERRRRHDRPVADRYDRAMRTDRLELRLPVEADRNRLVSLWMDDDFMVFSDGVRNRVQANERFDRMLAVADRFPFAKQPVIDLESGMVIGYSGMDTFTYEGRERLEYGYRLDTVARGRGLATEAARALLGLADSLASELDPFWRHEVYALIDPTNTPSQRVAEKCGFTFWRHDLVEGFHDDLLVRPLCSTERSVDGSAAGNTHTGRERR